MTDARDHLHAHREGTLLADGSASTIRLVQDRGRLVFPATPALAQAEEMTLFLPREDPADDDELQLMLSATQMDPADAGADRWQAYHGHPPLNRWAACTIDGARFKGRVVDHEPLNAPNPIAPAEPRLCRLLNADRARLATVCKLIAGIAPADPVAVGVDDLGIDIRARLGIIRLPFRDPAPTPADAESRIAALFGRPP